MKKFPLYILVAAALCLTQAASACTIPVFRFALEKWELTTYEILVYHRGPLPEDVQAALKQWSAAPAKANIEITVIDLDQGRPIAKDHKKLWEQGGSKESKCWMIVPSLPNEVANPIAWSGPCTPANLQAVISSPMRQAILAHLSRGASIVYVMLTSDDPKADERLFALLTKRLAALEQNLKLPVQSDDASSKLKLPLPLKVSLPLLVLDRNDPKEAALIRLLMATEEDMDKAEGPMVFPIFGRGRVLGSLYTPPAKKGAKKEEFPIDQIDAATNFLCKECSCMVKELNPGVDLLMPANWPYIFDEMFEARQAVPMPSTEFTSVQKAYSFQSRVAELEERQAVLEQRLARAEAQPPPAAPINAVATPNTSPRMQEVVPAPQSARPNDPPSESPSVQPARIFAPACCPGLNLLWLAAGFAGVLVLATGGWLIYRLRM